MSWGTVAEKFDRLAPDCERVKEAVRKLEQLENVKTLLEVTQT
jgi:hypothetical protein